MRPRTEPPEPPYPAPRRPAHEAALGHRSERQGRGGSFVKLGRIREGPVKGRAPLVSSGCLCRLCFDVSSELSIRFEVLHGHIHACGVQLYSARRPVTGLLTNHETSAILQSRSLSREVKREGVSTRARRLMRRFWLAPAKAAALAVQSHQSSGKLLALLVPR